MAVLPKVSPSKNVLDPLVEQVREAELQTGVAHVGLTTVYGSVVRPQKAEFAERFCFTFVKNLGRLRKAHQLSATALLVLMGYVELMEYHVVEVSQSQLAKDLGLSRQTVNRAVQELLAAGALIELEESGHRVINPNLFYMGQAIDLLVSGMLDQALLAAPETNAVVVGKQIARGKRGAK